MCSTRHLSFRLFSNFIKCVFVVDLRLHGVDEIILQPLRVKDIRDKYTKWTSAEMIIGNTVHIIML